MKNTLFTLVLAAIIFLTACSAGNEAAVETPSMVKESATVTEKPTSTQTENKQTTLPEGSFDRHFTGFWSDTGGWFIGCEDIDNGLNSNHYVYLTGDGGQTWTETGNLNDHYTLPVNSALFVSDAVGFLGFQYDFEYTGPVFRTEDGGKTWKDLMIPSLPEVKGQHWQQEPREIREMNGSIELTYFVSTSNYGDSGTMYKSVSEDMGNTWSAFTYSADVEGALPSGDFDRQFVYYWKTNNGWFVGSKDVEGTVMSYHSVYQTEDGGKTWTETGNVNDLYALPVTCAFFLNGDIGFLGFHYDFEDAGRIFRTEDGGETWEELSIPTLSEALGGKWHAEAKDIRNLGDTLEMTYFVSTAGYGGTGRLYKSYSEDAGKTWGPFTHSADVESEWIEDYLELLRGLDRNDVHSGAEAVNTLKTMNAELEIISDEVMTELLFFIQGMRPEHIYLFPDSIEYPKGGLTITDWTLDGMRIFMENYLSADCGEGTLYFEPDYVRIGMVLYDMVTPAYKDFYEMQFDISFFHLQKLFDDGVAVVPDKDLRLAFEIYSGFADKHAALARELGITGMVERLRDEI